MKSQLLIIFTKFPKIGTVKTRLIPALGADGACQLYKRMVHHVLDQVNSTEWDLQIQYDGASLTEVQSWLGPLTAVHQSQGDLGQRLHQAFILGFNLGYQSICIIGCDIPDLSSNEIQLSFEALRGADVTLGPTADGGYYLIGLKRPQNDLFEGISWSSSAVFQETLQKASRLNLAVHVGEPLHDIDTADDLIHLPKQLRPI